ncbi:MAG: hypothetical protein M1818_005641 [Claussenomyces sp. TS43310]|nr:MAG: hypothetical protein M1818_005641 [Claussenomyces sp. TS43310]
MNQGPDPTSIAADITLIWKLAARYKAHPTAACLKTKQPLHDHLAVRLLPVEEEAFWAPLAPTLGQAHNEFELSDLGASKSDATEPRRIDGVQCSAGATNASVEHTLTFIVGSVASGPCVINLTYEEGLLDEDMARLLAKRIRQRSLVVMEGREGPML